MYSNNEYGEREEDNTPRTRSTILVETKKHFLGILPYINYIKLKYGPEVWSGNNFMNRSNELNHGCVT